MKLAILVVACLAAASAFPQEEAVEDLAPVKASLMEAGQEAPLAADEEMAKAPAEGQRRRVTLLERRKAVMRRVSGRKVRPHHRQAPTTTTTTLAPEPEPEPVVEEVVEVEPAVEADVQPQEESVVEAPAEETLVEEEPKSSTKPKRPLTLAERRSRLASIRAGAPRRRRPSAQRKVATTAVEEASVKSPAETEAKVAPEPEKPAVRLRGTHRRGRPPPRPLETGPGVKVPISEKHRFVGRRTGSQTPVRISPSSEAVSPSETEGRKVRISRPTVRKSSRARATPKPEVLAEDSEVAATEDVAGSVAETAAPSDDNSKRFRARSGSVTSRNRTLPWIRPTSTTTSAPRIRRPVGGFPTPRPRRTTTVGPSQSLGNQESHFQLSPDEPEVTTENPHPQVTPDYGKPNYGGDDLQRKGGTIIITEVGTIEDTPKEEATAIISGLGTRRRGLARPESPKKASPAPSPPTERSQPAAADDRLYDDYYYDLPADYDYNAAATA